MAEEVRAKRISSVELISAHLERIAQINPVINAVVDVVADSALAQAREADAALSRGSNFGPLHGVPFSVKDSIDVEGTRTTAGTSGRRHAEIALRDATLVGRLRAAGAIPIAKTNLPDLLFSFETDNLIFGRTNNPYDTSRTPGGSSGGEAALISACGSPVGLGSDAFGSIRLPAAFCGITGIKPTSGRLPRTGHVPGPGGWVEAVWQIGPMARWTEDLVLTMRLLGYPEDQDFSSLPVPLIEARPVGKLRVAFFTDNGIVAATPAVRDAVIRSVEMLSEAGAWIEEQRPPGVEQAYELEFSVLGADGAEGIDEYLRSAGSAKQHWLAENFVNRLRACRCSAAELADRWAAWDLYREKLRGFFAHYDAIVCPVYPEAALPHGASGAEEKFKGFSYTMAWNMAGYPAATVCCAADGKLPINVQVVTAPWRDLEAIEICRTLEQRLGGWKAPATGG